MLRHCLATQQCTHHCTNPCTEQKLKFQQADDAPFLSHQPFSCTNLELCAQYWQAIAMPAIPSTQLPLHYQGTEYSGVYSVSGALMIARIPGVGSKSAELDEGVDFTQEATRLLTEILTGAEQEGRLQ